MISKNILSIIEKYKEDGTFVLIKNKIYWFNGNRLEWWYTFPSLGKFSILYYKNQLYCRNELGLLYYLKNLHFNWFSNASYGTLDVFERNVTFTFFEDHFYVKGFDDHIYDEKENFLARTKLSKMIAIKTHLYVYGHHVHLKIDLQTLKSTYFYNAALIDELCAFKNTIYVFEGTSFREIA